MQITPNNYSISEILEMLDRRDLIINRSYQRGTDLWPVGARSYFIDTIFNKYPFPKIYFFEEYDDESKRMRREIVDGQQRITTILSFFRGEFSLSEGHTAGGQKFSDVEDDLKRAFLSYPVAVDVIRDATQAEVVEMFRRMNAYTLPLNEAEKRHAAFQGSFKWAITRLAGDVGEFFSQFGVLTNRQMVRMADQELLAETYMFTQIGIFSSLPSLTKSVYKALDEEFPDDIKFADQVKEALQYISEKFPNLRKTFMMKPYALYTLLCALLYNKYGIADPERRPTPFSPTGQFAVNPKISAERLMSLANAHESKETEGPYRSYVAGCLSGTNRASQRTDRFEAVFSALQL